MSSYFFDLQASDLFGDLVEEMRELITESLHLEDNSKRNDVHLVRKASDGCIVGKDVQGLHTQFYEYLGHHSRTNALIDFGGHHLNIYISVDNLVRLIGTLASQTMTLTL